jgi:phosphate transport system permease protein
MSTAYKHRQWVNNIAFALTGVCALITLGILFFVLGYVAYHGFSSLNWDFFTKLPKPVGENGGGMANAIVGTFKLIGLASVVGLPVGVMGGIYLAEYGKDTTAGFLVRYSADIINGVPSIVMGIFAYTVVVLPMKHFSTLAGGIALGIMLIPIAVRSTEEFLLLVPMAIREAALALGLPRWKVIVRVVIPTAMKGLLTGVLLDLSRVSGETAPLLFTAFGNRFWSSGWMNPISSLPVMIFTYAVSPYEDWHRQAWAAALVLLMLVLATNVGARVLMRHQVRVVA